MEKTDKNGAVSRTPGSVPLFSYNSLVAKLRVLLDENLSRDLEKAFAKKIPVYTVADLGLSGAGDPRIIEEAVHKKCLVVTADRKFMDVYRKHEWRKGHDGRYFYGGTTGAASACGIAGAKTKLQGCK